MKKILLVFDGEHFATSLLDFAKELNSSEQVLLTGVFLPSVDYAEVLSYYYYGAVMAPVMLQEYDLDPILIKKNVDLFEEFCQAHNIRYSVRDDIQQHVAKGLKTESRYADLMVLSGAEFYKNLGEYTQAEYLHDAMHKAECPVLLLPEQYRRPTNVILTYDGSPTSMHAIRQFIYLFPDLTDLDTQIVYANDDGDQLPFRKLIREYAPLHFSKLGYTTFELDAKKYFSTWIANKGIPLVVGGSYGRSFWSGLFRKSFLEEVVREHQVPVFIAHH